MTKKKISKLTKKGAVNVLEGINDTGRNDSNDGLKHTGNFKRK
jgi:hypothetical protein